MMPQLDTDGPPFFHEFCRLVDMSDAWCAKGGAGDINTRLLRGWIWDNDSLSRTDEFARNRFMTFVDYTERLCVAHPEVYRFVQRLNFEDPEDAVMANLITNGVPLRPNDILRALQ